MAIILSLTSERDWQSALIVGRPAQRAFNQRDTLVGIQTAPAAAALAASLLVPGRTSPVDPARYAPARFAL